VLEAFIPIFFSGGPLKWREDGCGHLRVPTSSNLVLLSYITCYRITYVHTHTHTQLASFPGSSGLGMRLVHNLPTPNHIHTHTHTHKQTHLVNPPNPLSTTNAEILSFTSPVWGSLTGVWANTVNTSAIPPLLILQENRASLNLCLAAMFCFCYP